MKSSDSTNSVVFIFALCISLLSACKKDTVVAPVIIQPEVKPTISTILKPVTINVTEGINGYYIGFPSNYDTSTSRYPLLVFIPGAGQFGNGALDLPLLLKDGPAELFDEKRFPPTFNVNGKTFSFLVFTPQMERWMGVESIINCIEFVKRNYRVDSSRIYVSGLSIGGILACDVAVASPQVAAIVPIAGIPLDYTLNDKCEQMAKKNLPLWAFHSQDDPQFNVSWVKDFISTLSGLHPGVIPKLTVWDTGGHDAWTRAIEPAYKENGKNIYEWMLQYQTH